MVFPCGLRFICAGSFMREHKRYTVRKGGRYEYRIEKEKLNVFGIANDLLRQGGTAGGRNPAYYKKYITSGFD